MQRSLSPETHAVMSIIIPTTGLLLASAIIIVTIFTIIFSNPVQIDIEIQTQINTFITKLQTIDSAIFETNTTYYMPEGLTSYDLLLSPESISIIKETDKGTMIHREPIITKPWIRTSNDTWMSTKDLHRLLYVSFASNATQIDPIPETDELTQFLLDQWNSSYTTYLTNPYIFVNSRSIRIEKCILYLDKDHDGLWEKTDGKKEYLIIYQQDG